MTTGIALSVAFGNAENSPLPLVLVALLDLVFLAIEARRYRYFDIWRTRVRQMEISMFLVWSVQMSQALVIFLTGAVGTIIGFLFGTAFEISRQS